MSAARLNPIMYRGHELPPGVKGMRQAVKLGMDPYGFLKDARDKFGDRFTCVFPGIAPMVIISDPAEVQDAMKMKPEDIDATMSGVPMDIGAKGIVFLNNEEHQKDRKMVFPTIHGKNLKAFGPLMQNACRKVASEWKVGDELDISRTTEAMTLDVILRGVFGAQNEETVARFRDLVLDWSTLVGSPKVAIAASMFSGPRVRAFLDKRSLDSYDKKKYISPGLMRKAVPWMKMADARARLLAELKIEIDAAREANDLNRFDMLNIFCLTKTEDGDWLPDDSLLSELVTILFGGHETTARTSAWAYYYILRRPDVVAKIREEIANVFEGGPIDPDQIEKLKYLKAAIDESQRLAPIAVGFPRFLKRDVKLGERTYQAGVNLLISIYLIQNDRRVWGDDVEQFKPERMLEPTKFYHFLPFGGGVRRCIGAMFAQRQLLIQIAEVISRFDIRTDPDFVGHAQQSGQAADIKGPFIGKVDAILA